MDGIESAVERLDAALRGAGLPGLAAQTEERALEKIARTIAPWSLPADMQWFWEQFSFASVRARDWGMPHPLDPDAALMAYRSKPPPGVIGYGPPLLFPIASEDADRWSIELTTASSGGGIVFSHGGDQMYAEYPTFTDLIDVCAEVLEEGGFRMWDGAAELLPEYTNPRKEARFDAGPDLLEADARFVGVDPENWPARWLAAAGFDTPDYRPIGATHTIAEVVEASGDGPVRARIAGRVTRLVSMDEDAHVVVDDGTGTLAVWCPAGTSPWAVVIRRRYEFEMQVPQAAPDPSAFERDLRAPQEHASAGRPKATRDAAVRLVTGLRDTERAVATDIRLVE